MRTIAGAPGQAAESWREPASFRVPRPPDWMADALCASAGYPDAWFPPKGGQDDVHKLAREICARCPVRAECLDYALDHPELVGVWAGTTEVQRRRMRASRTRYATCEWCGIRFEVARQSRRFCGRACRQAAWQARQPRAVAA